MATAMMLATIWSMKNDFVFKPMPLGDSEFSYLLYQQTSHLALFLYEHGVMET